MSRTKVLILTALRIEAGYVRAAIGSSTDVQLRVIGMGATHLPAMRAEKPHCVVLAGFAGGLSPELRVGDVVVDAAGEQFALPPGARQGCVHGSLGAVTSVEQKRSLFTSNQCLAVDMESEAVRKWAAEAGVPLVIIRSISDAADQALPGALLSVVDEYGSPRLGRMAWALLRQPALLVHLLKLARCSGKAGKNLRRAVYQFIELNRSSISCTEPPRQ